MILARITGTIKDGDKMVKKITLLLCMVILLTLVACKQDPTLDNTDDTASTLSEVTDINQENTSLGIELEEDVFDDTNDAKAPIQSNQSDTTSSKKEEKVTQDTNSNKNDNSDDSTSSNKTEDSSSETTQDNETEESTSSNQTPTDTSSNEVSIEDGIIKLPVDKFD